MTQRRKFLNNSCISLIIVLGVSSGYVQNENILSKIIIKKHSTFLNHDRQFIIELYVIWTLIGKMSIKDVNTTR